MQELLTASVAPERETLLVPAVAVTVPAPQVPDKPFGVATNNPDGNVSVKAIPVSDAAFAAGFVIVKLSEVVPFIRMLDAPNALEIDGGADTLRVAAAVAPIPPSVEVTAPVVLFFVPADVAVTLIENVQEPLEASTPPDRLTEPDPKVADTVPPPQLPVKPLGVATTNPAGSESVKPTACRAVEEFGFETTKDSEVLPFNCKPAAPNDLEIVGGATTVIVAELLAAPAPLSFAETGLVVLTCGPAVTPVMFTLKVHELLMASVAPESETVADPAVAVMIPPPQVPVSPLGVAMASPEGNESVKETPVK